MSHASVFNCYLVGEKSSGRTSFLCHHIPREHLRGNGCIIGEGVIMHPLIISTSVGTIQFNIWDNDGMHGKCLVPTDCVIIFEGVSNNVALRTCDTWQTDLIIVIETIKLKAAYAPEPFNCFGELNAEWMEKTTTISMKLEYFNVLSLEAPHNIEKIFLWLSRKLLNNKKIEFFSYPVFLPRFFIRAQNAGQGFCSHCFCITVSNSDQMSPTSSSSSITGLHEENAELKGGGDSSSAMIRSQNIKNEEIEKKNEEEEEKGYDHNNNVDSE